MRFLAVKDDGIVLFCVVVVLACRTLGATPTTKLEIVSSCNKCFSRHRHCVTEPKERHTVVRDMRSCLV